MRVVQNIQMQLGEVDVSKVSFNLKSRDDIPRILRGLQHLYSDSALRAKIFEHSPYWRHSVAAGVQARAAEEEILRSGHRLKTGGVTKPAQLIP